MKTKALIATAAAAAALLAGLPATAQAATGLPSGLSQAQLNSSYGFFQWMTSNGDNDSQKRDARRALANLKSNLNDGFWGKYIKLGEASDGTNILNVRKALQIAVDSNNFRAGLTNEPCRVDLASGKGRRCDDANRRLRKQKINMQILEETQIAANYVAATHQHGAAGDGQNATWESSGFRAFYAEKPNYDRDMADNGRLDGNYGQTGHYVNYVNDDFEYAAFGAAGDYYLAQNLYLAANKGGMGDYSSCQAFGACGDNSGGNYNVGVVYPESLLSKVNQYINLLPGKGQTGGQNTNQGNSGQTTNQGNSGQTNAKPANTVAMQRLYNPNSGEHFYTANTHERDSLVRVGWRYEGVGWIAPSKSAVPVYRLYNANAGDHHYTMNSNERDSLVKAGWKYEGIGWYSDGSKRVPLYRQYNPNAKAGAHNYTVNKNENDTLVIGYGWRAEGIAWYAVAVK